MRNLEPLVNLVWLDLSFNSIEVIQGLDCCTKIADLSLYSNQIKAISGLDKLTQLNVLSLGKNCLSNLDESIKYLRGLNNKLEVLKISGNNFTQRGEKDYSKYAIAHLKGLKYLDYELITATQRAEANEEHKEEMQDHDQEAEDKNDGEGGAVSQELKDAKIGNTVNMFNNAIDSLGEEERKVKLFSKYPDCFATSEGQLEDFT